MAGNTQVNEIINKKFSHYGLVLCFEDNKTRHSDREYLKMDGVEL